MSGKSNRKQIETKYQTVEDDEGIENDEIDLQDEDNEEISSGTAGAAAKRDGIDEIKWDIE